jgi:hypothetical protein
MARLRHSGLWRAYGALAYGAPTALWPRFELRHKDTKVSRHKDDFADVLSLFEVATGGA